MENPELLRMMIEKLADDPAYLAYTIRRHFLAWDVLAADLGITSDQLGQLALCKRPTSAAGIEQVRAFVPIQADALSRLIGPGT